MLAPVVIFAYKRADHLKQVIEALQENELSEQSEVIVFSDMAVDDYDLQGVVEVRKYLEVLKKNHKFKTLEIKVAQSNKGLQKSIIDGVSEVITRYGRIIVLEDDIVVANDFLKYMNKALDFYEENEEVWSVTGYTELSGDISHRYETYAWYKAECWSWGTWSDRWRKVDWKVADYKKFMFSFRQRRKFAAIEADFPRMLDAQMAGAIKSWAVRWNYSSFKEEGYTVYPTITRAINIGFDGTGENCGIDSKTVGIEALTDLEIDCHMSELNGVCERIKKLYQSLNRHQYPVTITLKKEIKSLIRRMKWVVRSGK